MSRSSVRLAVFDTSLGPCAIAWSDRGVSGVQLPEPSPEATLRRLQRRVPGAQTAEPPATIRQVIGDIVALLDGDPVDLTRVELDDGHLPEFQRRVYAIARSIAPGSTLSYGEVAARLGDPGAARAVGAALGQNPYPIIVPCHRVLAAGGRSGGFSAHGGVETKLRLLEIERSRVPFELT